MNYITRNDGKYLPVSVRADIKNKSVGLDSSLYDTMIFKAYPWLSLDTLRRSIKPYGRKVKVRARYLIKLDQAPPPARALVLLRKGLRTMSLDGWKLKHIHYSRERIIDALFMRGFNESQVKTEAHI